MQHGTQHEDNGINIYKKRSGRKVYEFGCMKHPLFKFLGASPDGIDDKGEMLEIKMPYSRIPHEIPKKDYYFQMQLQMEVCNLDVCNFLECVVKEYNTKEEYEADIYTEGKTKKEKLTHSKNGLEKGIMLEGASMGNKKFFYRYSPLDIMPNKIDAWLEKAKVSIQKELEKDNLKFYDFKFRPVYWYATKYSCIRVYKDSNWINKHIAEFHKFWRTVEYYRKHGTKELEEFMKTGKSDCLPKHPGIINFPDMKIRKSKSFNIFSKNKCIIEMSDDDDVDILLQKVTQNKTKKSYKTLNNTNTPLQKVAHKNTKKSYKTQKKVKNTFKQSKCIVLSDSSDDENLSIF
jgi:hypothetical protein